MGQCMARGTEVEQVDIVEWSRAHPAIKIRGAKIKMTTNDYAFRCAVGDLSMADGQHFCEFTVVDGYTLKLGVVRPGYGELTNGKSAHMKDPHLEPEHCFYDFETGKCFRNGVADEWPGMQPALEAEGDAASAQVGEEEEEAAAAAEGGGGAAACRIGLMLDLDAGSLSVYKNDVRLGSMVDGRWAENSPMTGEYCWAVSTRERGDCVKVAAKGPQYIASCQG